MREVITVSVNRAALRFQRPGKAGRHGERLLVLVH